MKRRKFFKNSVKSGFSVGLFAIASSACSTSKNIETQKIPESEPTDPNQWHQMGSGTKPMPNRKRTVHSNVVVIGGGAAGICAAVSAARNGAQVVLIQDRPVLGGNSSSEVRVHLNGVNHLKDGLPERETGIIEEILLHNRFQNPQESFPVWDHVLYDFVTREPNIRLFLNTTAMRAIMDEGKIASVHCWQMTTELEYTFLADIFIDCSGDGLIAATAGALFRTGREAASEFNEKYAPQKADGWQMGSTVLLGSKDMGRPMPFDPPSFTIKYEPRVPSLKRKLIPFVEGFWWVELGSEDDIIAEFETTKHKLMGYAYGVWDYLKNSGLYPEADHYALDWVCSLPGKRESRRFIGDYILSESDMLSYKNFEDAVAYGGWSLDEHNPGGIENLDEPASYFHEKFSEPYQIPFRCLYSKNIPNLLFAGRNISQTHIALSSSRIMATCALEGQAVGTAASLCVKKEISPRLLGKKYISELQEQLLKDDVFIPNRPAHDTKDLAPKASHIFSSTTRSGDAKLLTDGISRDVKGKVHHWQSDSLPAEVQLEWEESVLISSVLIKCDTNVKRNIMMRKDSNNQGIYRNSIPQEMIKSVELEGRVKGQWVKLDSVSKNRTRLIKMKCNRTAMTAIRIRLTETYGHPHAKLFEIRCYT